MTRYLLLLLIVLPNVAFAQEMGFVNYEKCEYVMLHQNVYAPFYFHVNHDPTISQTFISRHDDNPNVVPFQRAPEGVEPGQATWFEFGSNANATATYDFQLSLEYAEKLEQPRVITVQMFQQGAGLMMEKKFYQDEKIGCIAFKVHATPPPHQFTPEEIIEIGKASTLAEIRQNTAAINNYSEENKGLKIALIMENLLIIGLGGIFFMLHKMSRSELKKARDDYERKGDFLLTAAQKQDINNKQLDLEILALEKHTERVDESFEKFKQAVIGVVGDSLAKTERYQKKFLDDLRAELAMVPHVDEEKTLTFVDVLEESQPESKQETPSDTKPDTKPDGESEHDSQFGFDLKFIRDVVTKPFKKREETKSEIKLLESELQKMSNKEIGELYEKYNKLAADDIYSGKGKTINYAKCILIKNFMNQRNTDVVKNK